MVSNISVYHYPRYNYFILYKERSTHIDGARNFIEGTWLQLIVFIRDQTEGGDLGLGHGSISEKRPSWLEVGLVRI